MLASGGIRTHKLTADSPGRPIPYKPVYNPVSIGPRVAEISARDCIRAGLQHFPNVIQWSQFQIFTAGVTAYLACVSFVGSEEEWIQSIAKIFS